MSISALRASIVLCDCYPDLTVGAISFRPFGPVAELAGLNNHGDEARSADLK